jgi:NAD(P)H-dependent FMN reductase
MKKIVLISGTNRPQSRTLHLCEHLAGIYRDLNVEVQVLDLVKLPQEIFQPTVYEEKPAAFEAWTEAILQADGLVVVVPEYNGSFPGILKYFIDLLPFPESFEDRAVCFVGLASGTWGALRAVEHLQGIFGYRNSHIYPKRVFLPRVHDFLPSDDLEEAVEQRLRAQSEGFLQYVEKISTTN